MSCCETEKKECYVCGEMITGCEIVDLGKCVVCRSCLKQEDSKEINIDMDWNAFNVLATLSNEKNISMSLLVCKILKRKMNDDKKEKKSSKED